MVCSEGARFILVQVECPYIQSFVASLLLNTRSRGYKRAGEGGAPKSLMRG
jgi:hypothetical protein